MKKVFLSLSVMLIILFCFKKIYAVNYDEEYVESYYSLNFDCLNSKNLNKLFENIKGTVIEVEVQVDRFNNTYRFNTGMLDNLEKDLTILVLEDLKEVTNREEVSIIEISGFNIIRIDLRCTKHDKDIIVKRSESL